jgi:hypothetical protein
MLSTKHDPNSSRTLLTVANLSREAREWQVPIEIDLNTFEMIANNDNGTDTGLRPFEARIYVGNSATCRWLWEKLSLQQKQGSSSR